MFIHYNNHIYTYDEDDFEKNVLITKLRIHTDLKLDKIYSIINIYLNMTRLKCKYDDGVETYVNDTLKRISL